jgi:hypothetical protein
VADGDRRRIADRGQVDRLIPGEEQAGVVRDDRPPVRGELQPELEEARVEGVVERRWDRRKVVDARRERLARTVQAPLLSVVPLRAARAPLPACSFVAPAVGSRSSVTCPVRGRVSPCPSQVSLPERPQCGCRTVPAFGRSVNGVIH